MLQFVRVDLTQLGTVSHRNTMGLVSAWSKSGAKQQQRVVVGDDNGYVACIEMKHDEAIQVFRHKISESGPITAVAIGTNPGGKGERIFAAEGQTIVGLQRKGKQFFKMESSLVEPIHHVTVEEQHLFTGCEYAYNTYDDGRDEGFYMCHDRIGAMAVGPRPPNGPRIVLLACEDRIVRAVCGSDLVFEAHLGESPVTTLKRFQYSSSREGEVFEFAFGTESGAVGVAECSQTGLRVIWLINDSCASRVNCIDVGSFSKSTTPDVVCGRADGRVQVVQKTGVVFESSIGEAVQSIACGSVVSVGATEIIFCTFAGSLVALIPPPEAAGLEDAEPAFALPEKRGARHSDATQAKIERLREDIVRLEAKVEAVRKVAATESTRIVSPPRFEPRTDFSLDAEHACYRVTVELPVPIDTTIIKSSVRVELVELEDKQAAIVSRTKLIEGRHQTGKQPIAFVAAFRCLETTNVLTFRLRTFEGEAGQLVALIVARCSPARSAQVAKFDIKALSLHRRVHDPTCHGETHDDDDATPTSELRFSGNFSAQMFHDWLAGCLPNVTPRLQIASSASSKQSLDHRLRFRNVYTGGKFDCEYADREARIVSDSLSALAIFKEHVAKEAVRLRIMITDQTLVNETTIPHFLSLLRPKLTAQVDLAKRADLIDAVSEIYSSDPDANQWISEEYRSIYTNADAIKDEFQKSVNALEYLTGILTTFLIDRFKFAGFDARRNIPQLEAAVRTCDYDQLLQIFQAKLAQ